MIPNDPAILLSFVNTKLRDFYSNLDDMCDDMELERKNIEDKLSLIGYKYSEERNQFIQRSRNDGNRDKKYDRQRPV